MRIQVVAFTENGWKTANRIFDSWTSLYNDKIEYRIKNDDEACVGEALSEWAQGGFQSKNALVFIGAMGIAVRTIAPFVKSKLEDSPVIVVDELGYNVIPVLSGHVGGANELAIKIAEQIGATPVITTATDLNGSFAVDVFARKNKLTILDKSGIAKVSAKILRGEKATVCVDNVLTFHCGMGITWPKELEPVDYPPKEGEVPGGEVDILISSDRSYDYMAKLPLEPKEYVLGIGCKKGKTCAEIEDFVKELGINIDKIAAVASIDVKKDEPGINQFVNRNRLEYVTYSAEELMAVQGEFTASEFVKSQVGVDNVCERAAARAALGDLQPEFILRKQAGNGITIAIAKRKWRFNFG